MTRSFRYHVGWIAAAALLLLLAGLVPLGIWSRERAIARETSEKAAVAALELLARLWVDHLGRMKSHHGPRDVAGLLGASMPSPSIDMPPEWERIFQADIRGLARATLYGYLFEAHPANGYLFQAVPAKDSSLRTFVVDVTGQVIAK